MPEISIIVLTFNSSKFIKSCLDSIFTQNYRDFETIVVDNGSKDNTVNLIKDNYPRIILIENNQNLGACKARNQGIEMSGGKWILTLDCDVILKEDLLKRLMEFVNKLDTSIGMVQPKILNLDKKTLYSCGIYLSWLRRFYDIGKGKIDNGQFNSSQYIFGACAAAALYRRKMLQDLKGDAGYFDERFFFLVEDVDLSWRAQRKGWRAAFSPQAICYHYGNSSETDKNLRRYLCFRNRNYTIIKNEGFRNYVKKILPWCFYDFPRICYIRLINFSEKYF
jgi:GT2 family glycosyltransferase